jgi:hypothetical protein
VFIVPATSVAASLHLVVGTHAHAGVVANCHGLLIGDAEVASSVICASAGGREIHATLEVLRLARVTINGAAPHVSNTLGVADEGQRMLAGLAGNAAIDGVSRAGVDGDGGWVWHLRAVDAGWVLVASRVGVGERWERNLWQVGVLLSVPLSGAWDRLDDWEALARHLVTGGAEWRVRWGWWVNQAETWFALLGRAHGNAVPRLADSDFIGDATVGVVARNSVLLANALQEAMDNLEGDPLPLAVALQLHDFLNCAVVSAGSLGMVVVVNSQNLIDLQSVGAGLLFEFGLFLVAGG